MAVCASGAGLLQAAGLAAAWVPLLAALAAGAKAAAAAQCAARWEHTDVRARPSSRATSGKLV